MIRQDETWNRHVGDIDGGNAVNDHVTERVLMQYSCQQQFFDLYFNIVGNYMTRQISFASYVLVLVSAFAFVGCGGGGGEATYEAPSDEITAEQIKESEDYEKQMEADNLRQQSEGTK
jgi:hypothetical protein